MKRLEEAAKAKCASRTGGARKPAAKAKKAVARKEKVVLLSGGNPRIAKADGDAPVQAYIAALPGWKRDLAKRLDALIVRTVPGVRKAVKWNQPFYGAGSDGDGWFVSFRCFTKYVKVSFFRGADLEPVPPGSGKQQDVRWLDVHEDDDVDDAQLRSWIDQASRLPGEVM